jgi:hypothetical protein
MIDKIALAGIVSHQHNARSTARYLGNETTPQKGDGHGSEKDLDAGW